MAWAFRRGCGAASFTVGAVWIRERGLLSFSRLTLFRSHRSFVANGRACYHGCSARGVAQPGRALRSGRRGHRFKSCHPDQLSCLEGADSYELGSARSRIHGRLQISDPLSPVHVSRTGSRNGGSSWRPLHPEPHFMLVAVANIVSVAIRHSDGQLFAAICPAFGNTCPYQTGIPS